MSGIFSEMRMVSFKTIVVKQSINRTSHMTHRQYLFCETDVSQPNTVTYLNLINALFHQHYCFL